MRPFVPAECHARRAAFRCIAELLVRETGTAHPLFRLALHVADMGSKRAERRFWDLAGNTLPTIILEALHEALEAENTRLEVVAQGHVLRDNGATIISVFVRPLNARICDRCTAAAVHARVLDKIAVLQTWERHTASGMTERADGTEFEPMTKNEREQLKYLIELRDMLRAELIEHGQIEA